MNPKSKKLTQFSPSEAGAQRRASRKGQAIVETALGGLFLALLLAGAIDFGRAFYTAGVVENMAGEGAAYAAIYPEYEYRNDSCSLQAVTDEISIQQRVRTVAKDRGLTIDLEDQRNAIITVSPVNCADRCLASTVTVEVTYRLNDLFLPNLLGVSEITITRAASQVITRSVPRNAACANGSWR